jgi:hypothetical protein
MGSRSSCATLFGVAALAAIALSASESALAQSAGATGSERLPTDPRARAHLERARSLYSGGDYRGALAELELGYSAEARPIFFYPMAQAHRKLGECDRAVTRYRQFLESNPPEEQAALARRGIEECAVILASSRPSSGSPPITEPRAQPHGDPPPRHVDAPQAQAEKESDQPAPWYLDPVGDGLAAAGVASLGVSLGYFFAARQSTSAAPDAVDIAAYDRLNDRAKRQRIVSMATLAAGGALLAGAAVRWVLVSRQVVEVGVWMHGDDVGVGLAGAF